MQVQSENERRAQEQAEIDEEMRRRANG